MNDESQATLKSSAAISTLYLGNNNIGASGGTTFAEVLKVNTAITTLFLNSNTIGDVGATAIAGALKVNAALTTLDLSSNTISDNGTVAIAEALQVNTALTTLYLHSNSIAGGGAIAIAQALKCNPTLTALDLSSNKISDEGATAIAGALKINTVLTILDLSSNNISDDGATAIAEALYFNTVLTALDLNSNSISDVGATAIADALKDNTALEALNLKNNTIRCSSHGSLNTNPDINRCKCGGIWSGVVCETNVPSTIVIAVICSMVTLFALVRYTNRRYVQPYLQRQALHLKQRQAERAFGRAHPIVVRALSGEVYRLADWGHSKDLKLELAKLAPDLGDSKSFMFLDSDGWTSVANTDGSSSDSRSDRPASTIVDTKYGSAHRAIMMQSDALENGAGTQFDIEMTLVCRAPESEV